MRECQVPNCREASDNKDIKNTEARFVENAYLSVAPNARSCCTVSICPLVRPCADTHTKRSVENANQKACMSWGWWLMSLGPTGCIT